MSLERSLTTKFYGFSGAVGETTVRLMTAFFDLQDIISGYGVIHRALYRTIENKCKE